MGLKLWFKAVASFSWYACARISEIFSLLHSHVGFDKSRSNLIDPSKSIRYHEYLLSDRKTEQGNKIYHLHYLRQCDYDIDAKRHFDAWIIYATVTLNHSFDCDVISPAIPMSRKYDDFNIEPQFKWGTEMAESSVTNLLNKIISAMMADEHFYAIRTLVMLAASKICT